jgi:cytochrome c-type biogenesis protein CcmH/NrfG
MAPKKKISFRAKRKLQQKIVFGILAAVLSMGLIGSSIVWTLGRSNVPEGFSRQEKPQATSAELEEKARANPADVYILTDLARAYERENQSAQAAETYEKALALAPDREDLKNGLAGSYISLGQYDRAEAVLKEAIGKNPGNIEAHYYYGHVLVAKKEYGRAVEEFELYIKLAGENHPGVESVKRLLETLKPLAKQ